MGIAKDLVSGLATAALTSSIGDPVSAAYVGATVQPIFNATIEEFKKRVLSVRETNRIDKVLNDAVNKIKIRLEKGDIPRNDGFWTESHVEVSDAKAILEGILLKSRDEYEEKKLPFYSNLISQMVFDTSWSYERLNAMIRMFEQLSYRQLQIMSLAQQKGEIQTPQWIVRFKKTPKSYAYYDLFCEVSGLSNLALFQQPGGGYMQGLGDKQELSPIGKSMADLMELSSMPQEELDALDKMLDLLNNAILLPLSQCVEHNFPVN